MSDGGVDPLSLINRFSDAEKKLSSQLFIAPYVPGGKVKIKVKEVVYELAVLDAGPLHEHGGFGLFQVTDPGKARFVEVAKREQIDAYLKILPRVTLVLIEEFEQHWWGLQAQSSDGRFSINQPVPVRLAERPASFKQIYARFDGANFWSHGENRRRDPSIASKLREALENDVLPDDVRVSGATPNELMVYRVIFFDRNPTLAAERALSKRPRTDLDRLRDALEHAGARLDTYWTSEDDQVIVRYVVDGRPHTANVRLSDFMVTSSGICLSGRDSEFDLTSLVGVMREYQRRMDNGDWEH
jgi:hypothetical protein